MTNKNLILASTAILLIVLAGGFFYIKSKNTTTPSATQTQATSTPNSTPIVNTSPPASSEPNAAKETNVTLTTDGYSPQTLNITVGTKVIWTNKSGEPATVNSDPHPIHTLWPFLNLGKFDDNANVSVIFDKAGTYTYHNHFDSSQKGTVIVK
jgi:plastocyanin